MSDTVKHTPGEWYGTGNGFVRAVGSGKAVAASYGDREDFEVDDRMMANERLIAAAPEMLEALMAIKSDETIRSVMKSPLWHKLTSAIAKAEGRS